MKTDKKTNLLENDNNYLKVWSLNSINIFYQEKNIMSKFKKRENILNYDFFKFKIFVDETNYFFINFSTESLMKNGKVFLQKILKT